MIDADGTSHSDTTDADGILPELSARDAWNGFTVAYSDNNLDFYILNYCVEQNSLFTYRHLQAMAPFAVILSLIHI